MLIRIVYALPEVQWQQSLDVLEGATVAEALAMSSFSHDHPEVDLSTHKLGVFAKLVKEDQVLQHEDRIEIYRGVPAKPRNAHAAEDKKARIRAKKERVAEAKDE